MYKTRKDVRRNSRVPVSTTGNPSPGKESQSRPVGLNSLHEARLITSLVEYYGWTLCTDGNLYNPCPGRGVNAA
jgi:hypothetical protein